MLNKVKDQYLYKGLLPTISDRKVTLNKAVQLMNNRGTVSGVHKAARNSEREKKRKADKMLAARSGDVVPRIGGPGEPIVRGTRAATARGLASLARGWCTTFKAY